jgi:hypothetical protein
MFGHNDKIDDNQNNGQPADPAMMQDQPLDTSNDSPDAPATTAPETTVPANPIVSPTPITQPAEPPKEDDKVDNKPATANNGDLADLKQQALQQLAPLVGQLDQTAEEKFHTTMMMIQATDNQALLPEAYQSAQKITDDKARAQALLDVINEINYFTQSN